jgi:hypothetical protein
LPQHLMRKRTEGVMSTYKIVPLGAVALLCVGASQLWVQSTGRSFEQAAVQYAQHLLSNGRQIFRYDTFGSEAFWGGELKLHQAVAGEKLGGVGLGLSPKKALELGLKVDMAAVPKRVAAAIKAGKVDLDDPANTLLLLKANAVVGVTASFSRDGKSITGIGVHCAPGSLGVPRLSPAQLFLRQWRGLTERGKSQPRNIAGTWPAGRLFLAPVSGVAAKMSGGRRA